MRTQSLYAQLKRPLTFSTWVTAQKTPKSRSRDEDAAREREREKERKRPRERARPFCLANPSFLEFAGAEIQNYTCPVCCFFLSQKSLFLLLFCFLKRRFFLSGSLWYRQTLAERMWRLCVCVCVCVCVFPLFFGCRLLFCSGVFLLSRGDNLHSFFKMMRKYSSRFATLSIYIYIQKYPLILLPTVWSLEQWSCCGFLALRLSLQLVNFLCFCYEVVAFVLRLQLYSGFSFCCFWDAFSEQRTVVLVSSFVIACVIDMTFIPAWKFFSHRRFCQSDRSQTLVCGDWKKTYFIFCLSFFSLLWWHGLRVAGKTFHVVWSNCCFRQQRKSTGQPKPQTFSNRMDAQQQQSMILSVPGIWHQINVFYGHWWGCKEYSDSPLEA